ncbi:MAG: nucleoside monophosphate kinase [Nanoarchaeota archaeon]|nr:nucleoside monophosphate kinase [Nanoarchaeota archaeon]
MIITISGKAGSGKSTVAKLVAKKLNMKHYSTGDLMREMAKERGMSLLELSKLAESDKSIDQELDDRQVKLGKEEDNFVMDSRLGFHFIPKSIKIFLETSIDVRAARILKDKRGYKDIKLVNKDILKREQSERQRYLDYYKIDDYSDSIYYNLVINTDDLDIDGVVNDIVTFVKAGKLLYK